MSSSGLFRDCIDKYYTRPVVVDECLQLINTHLSILPEHIIIEPSAGSGSFLDPLKKAYPNVQAYDILPESEDITKADFLDVELSKDAKYHFIGNPPFGRQSSMAKKFIKKACSYGMSVSFILPKSFKKSSLQKTFPMNFHMILSHDLPAYSFELNGEPYDVPCVFQIWERREYERETEEEIKPTYWTYVKKEENPDISFRRVGVYAGKIDKEIGSKSKESHYFIKLSVDVENFILRYNKFAHFSSDNTVGPKSISKGELNSVLFRLFQ
jgi:hypothetical protein